MIRARQHEALRENPQDLRAEVIDGTEDHLQALARSIEEKNPRARVNAPTFYAI